MRTLRLVLATSLPILVACSSTPKDDAPSGSKLGKPSVSLGAEGETDASDLFIRLDLAQRYWSNLQITAKDNTEKHRASKIEEDIRFRATRHQADLIQALETGPPSQRQIAAFALGFSEIRQLPSDARDKKRSHRIDPVGPLTAALQDPVPQVVANAAYALGLKATSSVPTSQLIQLLASSPDTQVRNNASWALLRIVTSGARPEGLAPVVRRALSDSEHGVRSHSAQMIALLMDFDSIDDLAQVLRDEKNLPAAAASRCLTFMGHRSKEHLGRCARALATALPEVRPAVRTWVLADLVALADRNYGDDADDEWLRWANDIP
ncbi:MAG: HEAT repeat domain-containing protein [Planctomycetota bacterium]|nr:HEAT repeat domain-containing protein [Planctomycetota bacterium]